MAMPALQRLLKRRLQIFAHIHIGGRARAAVQILVAAAHRIVHIGSIELHGDHARAVRQIPNHAAALRLYELCDTCHVQHAACFVMHMGERDGAEVASCLRNHLFDIALMG